MNGTWYQLMWFFDNLNGQIRSQVPVRSLGECTLEFAAKLEPFPAKSNSPWSMHRKTLEFHKTNSSIVKRDAC